MAMARSLAHILFFFLLVVSTAPAARDLPDATDNLDEACDETRFPELCVRSLTAYPGSRAASPRRLAELSVLAALDTGRDAAVFAHDELNSVKDDDGSMLIRCLDSCSGDVEEAVAHLSALSREPTDAKFLEVRDWLSATLGSGAAAYEAVCKDAPHSDIKDAAVAKSVEFDMMLRVTLDLITEASDSMSTDIALPPSQPGAPSPAYVATPSYGAHRPRAPAPSYGARKPRAPAPAPFKGYGHRRPRAPAQAPSPFRDYGAGMPRAPAPSPSGGYGHRRPRAPSPSPRRWRAPEPSPFGGYGSSAGAPSYGAPSYGARRPRAPALSPSNGAARRPRAPAPSPSYGAGRRPRAPAPSPSYGAARRPRAPAPSPLYGAARRPHAPAPSPSYGAARRPRAPAPSPFGGYGSARRPRVPAPSPFGGLGSARRPRAPAPSPFLGYGAPASGPAYGARRARAPAPSYGPSRAPKALTYAGSFENDETA